MIDNDDDEAWFDEDAGPLVRAYAVTRGRTKTSGTQLDLITLVAATGLQAQQLGPEHDSVLAVCVEQQSVAEVAAKVGLALGVVKVLISDLIERNCLMVRSRQTAVEPDLEMMQKVLDGIRRL
ncbi:Protein of unknown function [Actinokineospora alba]|uniref:DUF742 domain-containing protein n=1 Tax=Actinokineospora alba TaxID=504798 RepID=A0A1H0R0Q8_9PSEU|nr:DUF742 domain-containing protein [Actinokineospora alba]TDP70303.1 uncharacterized protein DUF742 [Actinokineospora alba]SDI34585.1 Protein of unknown function [Actinokineospora alba]SDP23057.1 Protein of unknown function [Actinokineospora alba]